MEKKPFLISDLKPVLAEAYRESLIRQLENSTTLFGFLPKPPPLTRKQKFVRKWKKFWNHVPDFIDYIKAYEYEEWRYKE